MKYGSTTRYLLPAIPHHGWCDGTSPPLGTWGYAVHMTTTTARGAWVACKGSGDASGVDDDEGVWDLVSTIKAVGWVVWAAGP